MAAVSGSLLMNSGVLRFVMKGERVAGRLPYFSPDAPQSRGGSAQIETLAETNLLDTIEATGLLGKEVESGKDALIAALRNQLKQQDGELSSLFILRTLVSSDHCFQCLFLSEYS